MEEAIMTKVIKRKLFLRKNISEKVYRGQLFVSIFGSLGHAYDLGCPKRGLNGYQIIVFCLLYGGDVVIYIHNNDIKQWYA